MSKKNAIATACVKRLGRRAKKVLVVAVSLSLCMGVLLPACNLQMPFVTETVEAKDDVVKLRICNWEEYIDEGDWDEDELIELDNGVEVFGENSLIDDFEDWYYENYGQKVEVEYSCFGTNEDLYNQLTLGDVYDLVCPSDYMIMKLMAEGKTVPFSDEFFDKEQELNYYTKGVSPYIEQIFDENEINGEAWSKYAAGFMFGVTGIIYNPEVVSEEEASTWEIINNPKFRRQISIKDNVRDSYFATLGLLKADELLSDEFLNDPNYHENLLEEMNDVSTETIEKSQDLLQQIKQNVYSFETDSLKSDMVSGKVMAGYQWSGDAVYTLDLADEDDYRLCFAVPKESTNIYFDGWVMLKSGISQDERKQQAAEAFVNFCSRPDNAVRNMYYIGYTSCIAGEEGDETIYDYLKWNYEAEDDCEETTEYPVGYFFSGDNTDEDYILTVDANEVNRQILAQYPSEEVIRRSAIMKYYPDDKNAEINQMWINVRCFNINTLGVFAYVLQAAIVLFVVVCIVLIVKHKKEEA